MANSDLTVLCTYRVQKRQEKSFLRLLRGHWGTLHRLGLTSDTPSIVYRGEEDGGAPFYVEIFSWKSARAVRSAHEYPEVMAVWEPMEKLCEERGGRPATEFPHVVPVKLARGAK